MFGLTKNGHPQPVELPEAFPMFACDIPSIVIFCPVKFQYGTPLNCQISQ